MTHKFCNADYQRLLSARTPPHLPPRPALFFKPPYAIQCDGGREMRENLCLPRVPDLQWHVVPLRITMMIPNDTLSNIHDLSMVTQPLSRLTPPRTTPSHRISK